VVGHLHTVLLDRRRGVKKVAATRQAKKMAQAAVSHVKPTPTTTTSDYYCGKYAKTSRRSRDGGTLDQL